MKSYPLIDVMDALKRNVIPVDDDDEYRPMIASVFSTKDYKLFSKYFAFDTEYTPNREFIRNLTDGIKDGSLVISSGKWQASKLGDKISILDQVTKLRIYRCSMNNINLFDNLTNLEIFVKCRERWDDSKDTYVDLSMLRPSDAICHTLKRLKYVIPLEPDRYLPDDEIISNFHLEYLELQNAVPNFVKGSPITKTLKVLVSYMSVYEDISFFENLEFLIGLEGENGNGGILKLKPNTPLNRSLQYVHNFSVERDTIHYLENIKELDVNVYNTDKEEYLSDKELSRLTTLGWVKISPKNKLDFLREEDHPLRNTLWYVQMNFRNDKLEKLLDSLEIKHSNNPMRIRFPVFDSPDLEKIDITGTTECDELTEMPNSDDDD